MRNRILALALLLILLAPAMPLAAEEANPPVPPCDPNAIYCAEAFSGARPETDNSGCLMVCYVVIACWQGCSSSQPSWYEWQDRQSHHTGCPARPSDVSVCL